MPTNIDADTIDEGLPPAKRGGDPVIQKSYEDEFGRFVVPGTTEPVPLTMKVWVVCEGPLSLAEYKRLVCIYNKTGLFDQ